MKPTRFDALRAVKKALDLAYQIRADVDRRRPPVYRTVEALANHLAGAGLAANGAGEQVATAHLIDALAYLATAGWHHTGTQKITKATARDISDAVKSAAEALGES
jgi:hypothetical protein